MKTCEEYVLGELKKTQDELEIATLEFNNLKKESDEKISRLEMENAVLSNIKDLFDFFIDNNLCVDIRENKALLRSYDNNIWSLKDKSPENKKYIDEILKYLESYFKSKNIKVDNLD